MIKLDTKWDEPKDAAEAFWTKIYWIMWRWMSKPLLESIADRLWERSADVEAVWEKVEILKEENRIEVEFRTIWSRIGVLSLEDSPQDCRNIERKATLYDPESGDTETVLAGVGKLCL